VLRLRTIGKLSEQGCSPSEAYQRDMTVVALTIVAVTIVALTALAKRINIAYPIVLVIGGVLLGFVPGMPIVQLPPDLVLVVFLPPLLFWESVNAPTSDFRASAFWIFQLAFGLVIITTVAVACVIHWIDPAIGWAVAFVLGAIVSSTDVIAFASISDRLRVPRHVTATIEGESLINDGTSLIIYGAAVAAVVGQSFSVVHAAGSLTLSLAGAIAIGIAAGAVMVFAWRITDDDELQPLIALMGPYLAYLPAYYMGASGVIAAITTGLFVNRYTPRVLRPLARQRATGFFTTIVFVVNAFIFTVVGMQLRGILAALSGYSPWTLALYAIAVSLTVVVVRIVWVYAQALLPATNEPEHVDGKADWSHVGILAWTGMRGGVSLAAALAIPLETAAGPFAQRELLIFLTFAVLLATLVGQGGSLPWLVRRWGVRDDGQDAREERVALSRAATVALSTLETIRREGVIPEVPADRLRARFEWRQVEFAGEEADDETICFAERYRDVERRLIDAQRGEIIRLRSAGEIDNTVMRRIQALLDHEQQEIELIGDSGRVNVGGE
jgi:Na+/H+ antiporter